MDKVLTVGLSLPEARYTNREQMSGFARRLMGNLKELPAVRSVGLISCLPVGGYCGDHIFTIEGRPQPRGEFLYALSRAASPDYFSAVGIPLLRGRAFSERDGTGFDEKHLHESAVVISQSMAKKFWPNQNALGQRIRFDEDDAPWYRVVGIAGDVRISLDQEPQRAYMCQYPTAYSPSSTP